MIYVEISKNGLVLVVEMIGNSKVSDYCELIKTKFLLLL